MKKESLKQQAYSIIKSKIINCEYKPGSFLNEEMLRDEIQMSRTPIRDALSRLEQENLVRILSKKGIIVSELTINEINMVYEVRMLIEPFTILNYGNKVSLDELKNLKSMFLDESYLDSIQKVYYLDDRLHQLLSNASGNKYLIQTLEYTHNQTCRLRILSGNIVEERLKESNREHISIIEYIENGNYKEASQSMISHLKKSKEASFKSLIQSGDDWIID